ncbi:MAG: hypothetical protein PHI85_00925 [Victivallaceae bacterium]|nr:hypothetical protein [Victivallaceae bacterium]
MNAKDPFRASWRFFHCDEHEIFEADDAEFDADARRMAVAGFTHVMTFSNTHFRWTFRGEWPRITEMLRRFTAACHRHGLKVIEHHSANLLYTAAAFKNTGDIAASRLDRLNYWPDIEKDSDPDSMFNGIRLGSMFQIDGTTGKPQQTLYTSYAMCHNNPDYMRLYTEYLATLYAVGIDGIMTDDVQFLADGYAACACPSCRRKFRERYGMELPECGEPWKKFIADETSPLFISWKKFRYESILEFHETIMRHYGKLGFKMLRPNFAATCVSWRSPWGGIFDTLPALDWAFIEHCCGVIRYSWPEFVVESVHCNMMAKERRIPAMSLYYPERIDDQRLCWALSLYCHHRYLGDPAKAELFDDQAAFHLFENAHFDQLFKGRQIVRIAIFGEAAGREIDPYYNSRTRDVLCSLGQAMTMNNLPWTMTDGSDAADFSVIVVPSPLMSDEQIRTLAASGAVLLWDEFAGTWNLDPVAPRQPDELDRLLGGAKIVRVPHEQLSGFYYKRCAVKNAADRDPVNCGEPGKWRLAVPEETAKWREMTGFVASFLDGGADIAVSGAPDGLLVSAFYDAQRPEMSLHICNASGTLVHPAAPGFGSVDTVEFPALPDVVVSLRKPEAWRSRVFLLAVLYVEQRGGDGLVVPVRNNGDRIEVKIPAGLMQEFALVVVRP